jgi:serine protease
MATSHVSSVAALIRRENPAWTHEEIRNAMTATALDLGEEGRDVHYGSGLVLAKDALDYLTS